MTATHTPDRLVVEAGKTAEATVTIGFSDGYSGEPAVFLRGLPVGVGVQIPSTEKGGAVKLRIAADASAKAANCPLTILVTEPGKANFVTSSSVIGADKAGGERLLNEVSHLWLTVKPKSPEPKKESM